MNNGHTQYQDTLPGNDIPGGDPFDIPAFLRRQKEPAMPETQHNATLNPLDSPELSKERAADAASEMLAPEPPEALPPDLPPPESDPEQPDDGLNPPPEPTEEDLIAAIRRLSIKEAEIRETKRLLKRQLDRKVKAL